HGAFQGKIIVREHAQKVDAHQLSRNLILGQRAVIDTKPELEIYADDVKCSHGASVGELDETALFYLRSRGIPDAEARHMLVDGIAEFYRSDYANVHRGVYSLSARSTDRFEEAREKARAFLNAADEREIVFLRGATEAINLVAQSWGPACLKPGDEIIISDVEHHSNIVPWQMLCERLGAPLVVAPTDPTGEFDLAAFEALLSPRTWLVAVTHISNVTGTLLPIARIVELAYATGAKVLVDGCQALPRMPVDVQAL